MYWACLILGFTKWRTEAMTKKDYKIILSEEISKQIDTDKGLLTAYWKTGKRLIEEKFPKSECLKFLQQFTKVWGEFKAIEMKGDFIDANIL